jgi:Bacterial conjugation TrbI-like protein
MDTFEDRSPDTTPTLPDMAELIGLDLETDDPVSSVSRPIPAEKATEEFSEDFASTEFVPEGIPAKEQEADIINEAEFNPEKNRTKVSFQHNGMAKALLVSGAGLAVIVGGMSFFQGQLPKQQVAQVVKKKDPVDDKVTTAQAAVTKAQQSESETKAQLALAKQKDSLEQAQQPDQTKSNQSETAAVAKASLDTAPPIVVVPRTTASNLTPVNVAPVATPFSTIVKSRIIAPAPTTAKPRTIAPVQSVAPAQSLVSAPIARPIPQPSPTNKRQPATQEIQIAANKSSLKSLKPIASPGLGTPIITYGTPDSRTKNINSQPSDPYAELQQLAAVGRFGTVTSGVEVAPPPSLNPGNNLRSNVPTAPVGLALTSSLPPLSQYFQNFTGQESEANANNQNSSTESRGARTAFANQRAIMGNKSIDKEPAKEAVIAKNIPAAIPETNSKDKELAAENSPKLTAASALTAFVTKNQETANSNPIDSDTQKPLSPTSPIKVAEAPLMIRTLLVGTSAKGSTLTPVLWGAGTNNAAKFLLKLDEPMLDGNNKEAFPAGTQFVVVAKSASNTIGLAELEVVSTIIKGMEFAAPGGSIVIRDDQGGLLIGEDYFKRNENIASRDMWSVFTGALGNVGRILNQPTSTVSSSINGGILNNSSVVSNRDPNIFGAVLEGGFRDLSGVLSQRNQQAIQELAGRPNVYQIPKGRGVRVFVNQSMTF